MQCHLSFSAVCMCCREVLLSRMESPRVASQVTTVPRTQTHSGLQECTRNALAGMYFSAKIKSTLYVFSLFAFVSATAIHSFSLLVLSLSVLTYIFMIDVNLPHSRPTTSPRIAEFTERVLARLKPLTEGEEEIQNHVVEENTEGDQDERTQAIKLLKTGVYFVCLSVCV